MYIESVFFILITLAVSSLYENENQNVDVDLFLEKALESWNNSKFNDAIFYLDEILKYDPDNILALGNKAGILMELEKYDEAIPYFEKVIEINPDLIEAINGKAMALYNMNKDSDALAMFYDAYKIDPFNPVTVKNMITILYENPPVDKLDRITAFAQIVVRDSDDQLVGITISDKILFHHTLALMFLESKVEWRPIEIDGKEFEVLEYSISYPILKSGMSSSTKIDLREKDGFGIYVIFITHNGFTTIPGDNLSAKIILLRPILD